MRLARNAAQSSNVRRNTRFPLRSEADKREGDGWLDCSEPIARHLVLDIPLPTSYGGRSARHWLEPAATGPGGSRPPPPPSRGRELRSIRWPGGPAAAELGLLLGGQPGPKESGGLEARPRA